MKKTKAEERTGGTGDCVHVCVCTHTRACLHVVTKERRPGGSERAHGYLGGRFSAEEGSPHAKPLGWTHGWHVQRVARRPVSAEWRGRGRSGRGGGGRWLGSSAAAKALQGSREVSRGPLNEV